MIDGNLKEFKGGLIAYNSTVEVVNNRFEMMKCKLCSGLVLSVKSCLLKVRNNWFVSNDGFEGTCI